MLTVECLRQEIKSGAAIYPVYVGFLSATDIAHVAEAPAFLTSTPHQQIAGNVSTQPVKDWQRPLDVGRIDRIADTFDDTGGLMPNPILLGQNAFVHGSIDLAPRTVGQGQLSGTWAVKIDDANTQAGQKPLWILDGQHRVAGLAKSKQNANPVPVVFLLDGGSGAYTSPLLASLFAQVTTSATKLDDLHNEWLTYAFELDSYSPDRPSASAEASAFSAVVELCRTPTFAGLANPFLNAIQFNEHLSWQPSHGGFAYKCTSLKTLLFKGYYNQPSAVGHLDPHELAQQLAMAYNALWVVVGNQADSVFFGPPAKQQSIMHDAYVSGVLARLLVVGAQHDWKTLLKSLGFHQSDWDFSWVRSLSGPANTASKRIATNVMASAMSSGTLPPGSTTIPDHLRGDAATVTLDLSALTAAGRPTKKGRISHVVLRGSTGSVSAVQHPHIRVAAQSSNVGKLDVLDATKPGKPIYYPDVQKRGLVLDAASGLPKPLELMFVMTHYGDLVMQSELRVNW